MIMIGNQKEPDFEQDGQGLICIAPYLSIFFNL